MSAEVAEAVAPIALPATERCAVEMLALARAYAAAEGISLATVGAYAVGDKNFFTRIDEGHRRFLVANYERAVMWFVQRWPDGVAWPRESTGSLSVSIKRGKRKTS